MDRQTQRKIGSFRLAAAIAATSLIAAGAWAAAGRQMNSVWDIQPSETWSEPKEIGKGELLVDPAMHARGLIEIMEDVDGPGGEMLLREGDKLYQIATSAGSVYCTTDDQPKIGNEGKFTLIVLVCLVDSNRDGTFDGHFREPATKGVPIVFGDVPTKLRANGAIRYEQRPTNATGGRFRMRVELDSDPAKAKTLRFTYSTADTVEEANKQLLQTVTEVRNGNYPQRFAVLDGVFELTGVSNGKAVVRMLTPTGAYPFLMERGSIKL
ncbi:MAG TPA: hypothetical protein VIT45_04820 [Allosphingosinicella sp.]